MKVTVQSPEPCIHLRFPRCQQGSEISMRIEARQWWFVGSVIGEGGCQGSPCVPGNLHEESVEVSTLFLVLSYF